MIVNIRGTHGSGKSTVVKSIMALADTIIEVPNLHKPKKPLGYFVTMRGGRSLYVVGSYETACGGCDAIQPYADIWPRVENAAERGWDVLFEGALVSSSYGEIGRSSEKFGEDFVFAFLNTPLDVCLARIVQRRAAKGNFEPLNPTNTEVKFHNVLRSRPKIENEFGRRCVTLDYTKPVKQVLGLFGIAITREPNWGA